MDIYIYDESLDMNFEAGIDEDYMDYVVHDSLSEEDDFDQENVAGANERGGGSNRMGCEEANVGSAPLRDEGGLSNYTSQSSCHSMNTGSDSDGVSYDCYDEFDSNKHMIALFFQLVLPLWMLTACAWL